MLIMMVALLLIFSGCAEAAGIEDTPAAQQVQAAEVLPAPTELVDRFSYALGYLQTSSYLSQGLEIDADYFNEAVTAAVDGTEPMFTMEELNAFLMEYQETYMAKQEAQLAVIAEENLISSERFLDENGVREGVSTTESGLQYEVIAEGEGPKPTAEDTVTVHYNGALIDGTVFDSSYQRGTPATFPLNGVIPGWTEGVQLMSVGSSYRFFIHPDLGYGENGAGDMIGPNEALIFDVELLGIEGTE